jgi:hypothetical protein
VLNAGIIADGEKTDLRRENIPWLSCLLATRTGAGGNNCIRLSRPGVSKTCWHSFADEAAFEASFFYASDAVVKACFLARCRRC